MERGGGIWRSVGVGDDRRRAAKPREGKQRRKWKSKRDKVSQIAQPNQGWYSVVSDGETRRIREQKGETNNRVHHKSTSTRGRRSYHGVWVRGRGESETTVRQQKRTWANETGFQVCARGMRESEIVIRAWYNLSQWERARYELV